MDCSTLLTGLPLRTIAIVGLAAGAVGTSTAQAAVIAHWRFEGTASTFLNDSSGNARSLHLPGSAANPTQYTLPAIPSSPGGRFPNPVPAGELANASAASFDGGDRFGATDDNAFTDNTFTVEAFINNSSSDASNKSIVGHWTSTGNQRSWLFALDASNRLAFLYSQNGTATNTISSTFTLSTNRDYYVAMSVNMADLTTSGIRFYVYDLQSGTSLQTAGAVHSHTALPNSTASLTIGATAQPSSPFSGIIDEVRLSDEVLAADQLLIVPEPASFALLAGPLALLLRRSPR